MKKRIFIAMHYMEIGGAEMSLIGLLQALNLDRYEVDLFVYSHRGELMKYIPSGVHLLPELKEYSLIEAPIKQVLRKGCLKLFFARLSAKIRYRIYAWKRKPQDGSAVFQFVANSVTPCLPSLHSLGVYDLAVSFLTPHNIVRDKVLAHKKICWIHTDYAYIDVQEKMEHPVWASYDKIMSISSAVTQNFVKRFPDLKGRVMEFKNILSPTFVRKRAKEIPLEKVKREMCCADDEFCLLSIGRFTSPKNYDNLPDICKRINEKGIKVKWFIIGYGGEEPLIRSKIQEAGMEGRVVILGKRENPYPYISACDVYVQPSRFEGNSVTVREAQILGKPVVITRYATAESQVETGIDGMIVPMDNEGCANGLVSFLQNHEMQERIKTYLLAQDYGNLAEIKKIEALMETV